MTQARVKLVIDLLREIGRIRARWLGIIGAGFVFGSAGVFAATNPGMLQSNAGPMAYHVDCSASSSGDGTIESPWNALSDVNGHSGGFGPGDSILLKAGTTCAGQLAPVGSGDQASPIVVSSYDAGARPIVAGGGTVEAAVLLLNMSHVRVSGLEVTNTANDSAQVQRSGILIEATGNNAYADVTIEDNVVHHVSGVSDRSATGRYSSAAILVRTPVSGSGNSAHFEGVTIQRNQIYDVGCMGIALVGGNGGDATVRNTQVLVAHNQIDRAAADSILVGVSVAPRIEYNVANDSGYNGVNLGFIVAIWAYNASDPTFQFNEAARTAPSGDSQAWDCDWGISGTCTFQYNYSHDNTGGFFLDCSGCVTATAPNIVVRYNVSVNESRIVGTGSSSGNVEFHNNTFYAPGRTFDVSFASGARVRNNIFVGSGFSLGSSGAVLSHNLYAGFSPPGEDDSPLVGDPQFSNPGGNGAGLASADGYRLATGSPALAAGTFIAGNGGRDYFGNAVPTSGAPSIGADQGSGGAGAGGGNLIANPGLETGDASNWSVYNGTSVGSGGHDGNYALNAPYAGSGATQIVYGLQPNTAYRLTAFLRNAADGEEIAFGVKNYDGPEQAWSSTSASWGSSTIDFTTGGNGSSAEIYCYKVSGSSTSSCDDFSLVAVSGGSGDGGSGGGGSVPQVANGGFEAGDTGNWSAYGGSDAVAGGQTGSYSLYLPAAGSGAGQVVTGLQPSTTYTLTAALRSTNAGEQVAFGLKNYGGPEQAWYASSSAWTSGSLQFTTGASDTSVEIYCYMVSGSAGSRCDDFVLSQP